MTYELDAPCWIFAGATKAGVPCLEKGRVVGTFQMTDSPIIYYIILLDNQEWMHLEVRDALLMSASPDELPLFVKRSANGGVPSMSMADIFGADVDDVIEEEPDSASLTE